MASVLEYYIFFLNMLPFLEYYILFKSGFRFWNMMYMFKNGGIFDVEAVSSITRVTTSSSTPQCFDKHAPFHLDIFQSGLVLLIFSSKSRSSSFVKKSGARKSPGILCCSNFLGRYASDNKGLILQPPTEAAFSFFSRVEGGVTSTTTRRHLSKWGKLE